MTQYRTSKGKFVARSNPIAVIGQLNAQAQAKREKAARDAVMARRANLARYGVRTPLTRAELAEMAE